MPKTDKPDSGSSNSLITSHPGDLWVALIVVVLGALLLLTTTLG